MSTTTTAATRERDSDVKWYGESWHPAQMQVAFCSLRLLKQASTFTTRTYAWSVACRTDARARARMFTGQLDMLGAELCKPVVKLWVKEKSTAVQLCHAFYQ
jgi:hypothetical protein